MFVNDLCLLQTKCESYMPEGHARFGDIEVVVTSLAERSGYLLRNVTLKVRSSAVLHVCPSSEKYVLKLYSGDFLEDLKFPESSVVCLKYLNMAVLSFSEEAKSGVCSTTGT